MDPTLRAQLEMYQPWFFIIAVLVLFALLRLTRKGLRRRVDEIGYHLFGERGLMIWFWLNAPGVILHELSHALVVLLFYPFGFRITSITLFMIKPKIQEGQQGGRFMRSNGRTSLQLGEVQYVRPQGRIMSYIGDGLSAVAPLFGGLLVFCFLYWVATGHVLWDAWNCGTFAAAQGPTLQNAWQCANLQHILQPGWPWWTLTFTPYLVLTVTSELWPSHQDWRGARWLLGGVLVLALLLGALLWAAGTLVFNAVLLENIASFSTRINFALLLLLALDLIFFTLAALIARVVRI
ncbi:MAG: hypothetical protein ACRDHZ_10965 [Ktedonobacteraceae bacterium]